MSVSVDPGAPARIAAGDGVAAQLKNVTRRFGKLVAVDDLSLDVPEGSLVGLIGPNGAGKTTTLLMLATLLSPSSGRVVVGGTDPAAQPRRARAGVGYMPDVMGVYDNLRVTEYLQFFAAAHRVPPGEWSGLITGLLELVELDVKRDAMVDSLSRGMKQRLSLARAMVHDPELLVLDEPASGLDPRARVELRRLLLDLQGMGKTIVVSSHILAELAEMCSHVAIMEQGRLVATGTPAEIKAGLKGARQVEVRFAGGEVRNFEVRDDEQQAEMIRRLVVEEERDILEVREVGGDLESLFMRLTKGEVQ